MLAPHPPMPRSAAKAPVSTLTLDAGLQAGLEALARDRAALGPSVSVAFIAVDDGTGEMLARVGSAGFSMTAAPAGST